MDVLTSLLCSSGCSWAGVVVVADQCHRGATKGALDVWGKDFLCQLQAEYYTVMTLLLCYNTMLLITSVYPTTVCPTTFTLDTLAALNLILKWIGCSLMLIHISCYENTWRGHWDQGWGWVWAVKFMFFYVWALTKWFCAEGDHSKLTGDKEKTRTGEVEK